MLTNNHCGRSGCLCTHTAPCEFGWIWFEYYDEQQYRTASGTKVKTIARNGVKFCPTCSPERAVLQKQAKDSNELGEKLRARSNANRTKAYEENESSKTRTL